MASAAKPTLALFAASFDPITNGHMDLIERSLSVFDELVVAVGHNVAKSGTFTLEERIYLLKESLRGNERVRVEEFQGLVVDYAESIGASAIVRGLRAMSDFEYEFEMALMNRHMKPDIETLFLMTSQTYLYVSSSRLKELTKFGRDVSEFVPPPVAKALREKLG